MRIPRRLILLLITLRQSPIKNLLFSNTQPTVPAIKTSQSPISSPGHESDSRSIRVETHKVVALAEGIYLVRVTGSVVEMIVVILGVGELENEAVQGVGRTVKCISCDGRLGPEFVGCGLPIFVA